MLSGRWGVVAIVALCAVCYKFNVYLHSQFPSTIHGTQDDKFLSVRKAFEANFIDGWEPEGASFSVYQNGKKVVDLWGGFADKQSARPWKEDTLTVTFSATKAVAAVCVALLVDRGRLRYDDLVSKHWPGFAKNFKENITIQMALSHMAGLSYVDTPITEDMAFDHNKMRKILEDEYPKFPPGAGISGYGAYTFGWIVDQIIRHVDEKKRGIGQFFREEIAQLNEIDYHIGLPLSESYRVARIRVPTIFDRISEVITNPRVIVYFRHLFSLMRDTPLRRVVSNPSWLQAVAKCTLNNPDYHRLEQAAALGIGNARSLAAVFNKLVNGDIVTKERMEELSHHYINVTDWVFGDQVAKGHGFLYLPSHRKSTKFLIGHTGHGCQQVLYDEKNKLAIAYVSNGLKTGLYDMCRTYMRLHHAVYDVIENISQ